MSDYTQTLGRLYALIPRGSNLGLERIEAACAKFGNPERAFEAIHVAGTNGKGSVCAFVASMLKASGAKVGMYTSPHLCKYTERIQIDGAPIEEATLAPILNQVLDTAPDLSFYEATTLAAFIAFKQAGVQTAVIEVGLGGRLDATNVIPPPKVAVITRVAFDHMDRLGTELSQIAGEKAAIIKAGTTVVTGRLHPDARAQVEARMREVGATEIELGEAEPFPGAQLAYPRMAMYGNNLAIATTIARFLGLDPTVMSQGIEATSWPGRNELLHRNGQELTLLDCAHNPDGAVTLSHIVEASLMETVGNRKSVALVFGTVAGKNWKAMLDRLEGAALHRVYVAPPVSNAVPPEEMAAVLEGAVAPDIIAGMSQARQLVGTRGLVIVTGSTFLVGAARAALLGLEADPPVPM